jgi:hypothetical protein
MSCVSPRRPVGLRASWPTGRRRTISSQTTTARRGAGLDAGACGRRAAARTSPRGSRRRRRQIERPRGSVISCRRGRISRATARSWASSSCLMLCSWIGAVNGWDGRACPFLDPTVSINRAGGVPPDRRSTPIGPPAAHAAGLRVPVAAAGGTCRRSATTSERSCPVTSNLSSVWLRSSMKRRHSSGLSASRDGSPPLSDPCTSVDLRPLRPASRSPGT